MATVREHPEPRQPDDEAQSQQERIERVAPYMTPQQRRPRYGQPFFPTVIFGTSMYVLATAIALVILARTSPAPLQAPADPLNHALFNPRPEWYFLFLFQILKIFQGPLELIGTLVVPAIIGAILILLPFYDRNWSRRAVKRPVAIACAAVAIFGLAYLTYIPIESTAALNTSTSAYLTAVSPTPKWSNIEAIFAKNCQGCHVGANGNFLGGLDLETYQSAMKGGNGQGPVKGPVIVPNNAKGSYLWQVVAWRKDLYGAKGGANMPLGKAQISKVDQQNIFNWIQNGAKNNG